MLQKTLSPQDYANHTDIMLADNHQYVKPIKTPLPADIEMQQNKICLYLQNLLQ